MEADPSQALEMLNAFESVGAYVFDITLTDLDGKMLEKGFFPQPNRQGIAPHCPPSTSTTPFTQPAPRCEET